jgi:ribose 5-phosphate isomerase B
MNLVLGSDHRGYQYKAHLVKALQKPGVQIYDVGAFGDQISVDYPEYSRRLAADVNFYQREPSPAFGILVCGSGHGVAMAANRVPGIRAATCRTVEDAIAAREHNNANVVTIGADFTDLNSATRIVRAFIGAVFDGGERHCRRVDMIDQIVDNTPTRF